MIYLSLFSGVGGGDLAAQHMLGWRACVYVEWDPYCQEVLHARQQDGWLDVAPVFGDVRGFVGDGFAECLHGMVDVVLAGFPCQPFSVAGKQRGEDDPRNMWPATRDVLRVVRPRHALLENVAGLVAHDYWTVIMSALAALGYDARWTCVRASDAGAPHRRERVFVWCALADADRGSAVEQECDRRREGPPVAHRNDERGGMADPERSGRKERHAPMADASRASRARHGRPLEGETGHPAEGGAGEDVGDPDGRRQLQQGRYEPEGRGWPRDSPESRGWWGTDPADRSAESRVGRVAHGVAHRVDRLRACGNGIVPHQLALAWRVLTGA